MFIHYNPNPLHKLVGDCVIRAVSKVTNEDWKTTYMNIALQGYLMMDIPKNLQNDPHQAVQYLLNNGQMQQNTFNNITRFCQSMGIRLF